MENMEQNIPEQVSPEQAPPEKGSHINGANIWIAVVIILVALAVAFVLFRDTTPTFGELGRTAALSGTITTVDVGALTLTLTSTRGVTEKTINIEPEARIYRDLAGGATSSLVEINLADLNGGEEANIIYDKAVDDTIYGVEAVIVYDSRSFDEYSITAEPSALLPATLVGLEEGTINISFTLPAEVANEEGDTQTIAFPITSDTSVWYVPDATRAHIFHTRKEASFAELAIGDEIILEFSGSVVSSIIIPSEEN